MNPSLVTGLFGLATLLSGAAALFYETLWFRAFSILLGSTVQAASSVLAAFMLGLALGAFILGKASTKMARPSVAYGLIEGGIAFLGASTTLFLLHYADQLAFRLGHRPSVFTAFGVASLVLIGPTFLMGATFPVLLTAYRSNARDVRLRVGLLYGMNVLGGALGAFLCGFFLLPALGVSKTAFVAALLNVASSLLVLAFSKTSSGHGSAESKAPLDSMSEIPKEAELLALATLSGAGVLGLEVVFTRIASYALGNRTYAFTTLLFFVLLHLSLGSQIGSRLLRPFSKSIRVLLGLITLASSVGISLSATTGHLWVRQQFALEGLLANFPWTLGFVKLLVIGLIMALAFIPMGMVFPTVMAVARRLEEQTGRAVGQYYLWNTVGSILGSLAVGFYLISAVGAMGVATLVAALFGLFALWLFLFHLSAKGVIGRALLAIGAAGAVALAPLLVPERLAIFMPDETPIMRVEDEWGIFQVSRLKDGTLKVTNNRTELVYHLGRFATSYVQQMQGHLGVLYNPSAEKALVLGSGYGITAGALALHPNIRRVDAVEIIPAMVEAAPLFEPYNLGYHKSPKVRIFVDDGRHFLVRSKEIYDIISINVSDPHLPGGSSLFHLDFYEEVKRHLSPKGVVIQHAFGSDRGTVLRTLQEAFPFLVLYPAYGNGFNVVAALHPLRYDIEMAKKILEVPEVAEQMRSFGLFDPIEPAPFFAHAISPDERPELFVGDIATDDWPAIEFSRKGGLLKIFFSNE